MCAKCYNDGGVVGAEVQVALYFSVYIRDSFGDCKSSKSGILFKSAGQYVGSPVDKYFRLSCRIVV